MRPFHFSLEVVSIEANTAPVGIKLAPAGLNTSPGHGYKLYSGPAYCDAVSRASCGERLLITSGSITRCRWAPVVLGLKKAENRFEKGLAPRFENMESIYAFPLEQRNEETLQPDLVIVRDRPSLIATMFKELADGRLEGPHAYRFDTSALAVIYREKAVPRAGAVKIFNRLIYHLKGRRWFRKTAEFALKSPPACYLFDKFIARFLADMSVCRNSTVIPALKEKANCSYFCSGAIFWGGNDPAYMTAGISYDLFCRLENKLVLTGSGENSTEILEQRRADSERRGQNRQL